MITLGSRAILSASDTVFKLIDQYDVRDGQDQNIRDKSVGALWDLLQVISEVRCILANLDFEKCSMQNFKLHLVKFSPRRAIIHTLQRTIPNVVF